MRYVLGLLLLASPFTAVTAAQNLIVQQSLANDWPHVWATPYWTDDVATTESTYGQVDQLEYVWWLEWFSPQIALPAGEFAARVRLKKRLGTFGRHDLTLSIGSLGVSSVLPADQQPVDTWVWTPDLVFSLSQPTTISLRLHEILTGLTKDDYWFDAFEIEQLCSLCGTPAEVSVSLGGSQVLAMDVDDALAGKSYLVLGSVSGESPGVAWGATAVPLNFDPYLLFTLNNQNTPLLNGSAGFLNSLGQATTVFTLPPGGDPALVGLTVHHAGIVVDFVAGALLLPAVTNAEPVTLLP